MVEIAGVRCGVTICEDIWRSGAAGAAQEAGAQVLLVINGSPYDTSSQRRREDVIRARVAETGLPLIYCNMVGGQDELIFDGGSMVVDADGEVVQRAPAFEDAMLLVDLEIKGSAVRPLPGPVAPVLEDESGVYQALVLGVRDYVNKHRFPGLFWVCREVSTPR